ncbi:MAG: hypothetical protein OQK82_05770 [Candidatus Pacearchaeota archaeon]|nr:hypothetical protein [Candidatus Pacearchaeota archaeon]
MNVEVIEDKRNDLFNRKEIKFEVEADVTPSKEEMLRLISERFKADSENVAINKIEGKFGVQKFLVSASVYDSKADKDNFEIKTKKQREAEKKAKEEEEKKLAEERKKAKEEAVEAKVEAEKPVEENKEEEKSEEKKE